MKAHIKMHQHNAPFVCGSCTYSTYRYNALKDHLDLHIIKINNNKEEEKLNCNTSENNYLDMSKIVQVNILD